MLEALSKPSSDAASWPDPAVLLPHGDAARCVDRILAFVPGEHIRATWRVRATSLLFEPAYGCVPNWAGIEVMAQCAGLYLGLAYCDEPAAPPLHSGYLVGVRRFRAHRPAALGVNAELTIEAVCKETHGVAETVGLFDCRILCEDIECCDARLMLWCADRGKGGA